MIERPEGIVAVAVAALATIALLLAVETPARATIDGPCTAAIAGRDVTSGFDTPGERIEVDHEATIPASGGSTNGVDVLTVQYELDLFGVGVGVSEFEQTSGTTWSDSIAVSDYAWAVGLYKVAGTASLADGTTCVGSAFVCVSGANAFATIPGVTAGAIGLVSIAALALAVLGASRSTTARTVLGGLGAAGLTAASFVLLQATCSQEWTPAKGLLLPAIAAGLVAIPLYLLPRSRPS